jgi:hypothetical protein
MQDAHLAGPTMGRGRYPKREVGWGGWGTGGVVGGCGRSRPRGTDCHGHAGADCHDVTNWGSNWGSNWCSNWAGDLMWQAAGGGDVGWQQ